MCAPETILALQITAVASNAITPAWDEKGKALIARKSGYKHVSGDIYKQRTNWKKICDFISASRGPSIVAKGHFESRHYVQMALIRKDFAAQKKESVLGRALKDDEYDAEVWNSNGVQNRIMREDFIRYHPEHFTINNGASQRNSWAYKFSHFGHTLHGICEMNAAPTGMTYNIARNTATSGVEERSTRNKAYMFLGLGFIGVATTQMLLAIQSKTGEIAFFVGQTASTALVAFPAISSTIGLLGTVAGVLSQLTVEKQRLDDKQKGILNDDLNTNLQKLLFRLKTVKDQAPLVERMGKAMQGRHLFKHIRGDNLGKNGVPKLLRNVLDAIDLNKSDLENLHALKNTLGAYFQIEKPVGEAASLWACYKYAKAVTAKESHGVSLFGLIDHMEIDNPNEAELKDLRRIVEEKHAPKLHNFLLKTIAYPATLIDSVAKTNIAPTLRKWTTPQYLQARKAERTNPVNASKYCFTGGYMATHIHQYGPVTHFLLKLADAMYLFNMNIVLASNANLSRVFNNLAIQIQRGLGTGPASRSMCNSIGRFFGGALLAILFGTAIPLAADGTGNAFTYNADVGTDSPVRFSVANIGILMFLLATPTLMVQGLAHVAARLEGWNGNIPKSLPAGVKAVKWTTPKISVQ